MHQILVCNFAFHVGGTGWFTARAAAAKTNVPPRTVRRHLHRLVNIGILERRKAFGGCRYRQREEADLDDRAMAYLKRLGEIRQTFERKPGRIRTTLASFAGMLAI